MSAENTNHADRVASWLEQQRGLTQDEILVTHSRKAKTEEELERLVGIELPQSRVRVVVNVFELSEGWDVTNVYVIAPLRAMGTYQGALQTMGRGLRLPAGHRVEDQELDSLDVLCFGRQSLEDVLKRAIDDYGSKEDRENVIGVLDENDEALQEPLATKRYVISARAPVELDVPRIRRLPIEPELGFDIRTLRSIARGSAAELELSTLSVAGTAEGLKYDFDVIVRLAAARVVSGLRYLSDPLHGDAVEHLVAGFLEVLGFDRDRSVEADWMFIAAIVAEEIDKRYRRIAATYEATPSRQTLLFGGYEWIVREGFSSPAASSTISAWQPATHRRIPIGGWTCCTAEAVAFDTSHEFLGARLIDRASSVAWWARNDPPQLVISTPIGRYAPDFVVELTDERRLVLEIKQSDMWEAPQSDARVKARAAAAWCAAVTTAQADGGWSYWVVLDEDIHRATTLEALADLSVADAA